MQSALVPVCPETRASAGQRKREKQTRLPMRPAYFLAAALPCSHCLHLPSLANSLNTQPQVRASEHEFLSRPDACHEGTLFQRWTFSLTLRVVSESKDSCVRQTTSTLP